MSDQNGDSGSRDRATVALVNSKIDTVLAKIEGNADTTNAKIDSLVSRIDSYSALPAQVNAQHEMLSLLMGRVTVIEKDKERRLIHWPTFIVACSAVIVAAMNYIH